MASKINSRKGIIMTRKEKFALTFFLISMVLMWSSMIYTINQLRPIGYVFPIEKFFKNIKCELIKK